MELLDVKKIIFIDATFSNQTPYALACSLEKSLNSNLSHHISPFTIIELLKTLYKKDCEFEIFSIFTNNFDFIENEFKYKKGIFDTSTFILNTIN